MCGILVSVDGRVVCCALAWLRRDGTTPIVCFLPEVSIRRDHPRQVKPYKVVRCGEVGIVLRHFLFHRFLKIASPSSHRRLRLRKPPRPTLRVRMREGRSSDWIDQTDLALVILTFGVGRGHLARAQIELRIARSVGLAH